MFSSVVVAGDDILYTQYNNLRKDRIPIGGMVWYGADTAPSTWFLCDGSAVSRTTYANLFTILSTTFGVGDGSTTFNLPDTRDKFIIGKSGTKALGSTGGANSVTLTTTNLPSHTHSISSDGSHSHLIEVFDNAAATTKVSKVGDGTGVFNVTTSVGGDFAHDHSGTVNNEGESSPTAIDLTPRYVALKCVVQYGITADVAQRDDFLDSQMNNLSTEAVPTGGVVLYGDTTAPTGYLLADGTAVSRTTYSDLFAIIGTTFGVGDGSTTFNVPDLENQFIIGASGTKAVGSTGGSTQITLVAANLPQHNHGITATTTHTHTAPGFTGTGTSTLGGINSSLTANVATLAAGAHDHSGTGSKGSTAAFDFNPSYQALVYLIKY